MPKQAGDKRDGDDERLLLPQGAGKLDEVNLVTCHRIQNLRGGNSVHLEFRLAKSAAQSCALVDTTSKRESSVSLRAAILPASSKNTSDKRQL